MKSDYRSYGSCETLETLPDKFLLPLQQVLADRDWEAEDLLIGQAQAWMNQRTGVLAEAKGVRHSYVMGSIEACGKPSMGNRNVHTHIKGVYTLAIGADDRKVGTIVLPGLHPADMIAGIDENENRISRDVGDFVELGPDGEYALREEFKAKEPEITVVQPKNGQLLYFDAPHAEPPLAAGTLRLLISTL